MLGFGLAVLAGFVLLLTVMPWERPHPNHVFVLEMLERLSDEVSRAVSESGGVSGLRETVSSQSDKPGDQP
jgi:hypothetical protein